MGVQNEKAFDNLAWALHKRGVRPDHLSLLQLPVYVSIVLVVLRSKTDPDLLWAFLLLQVLVIVLDGADGILARRTGTVSRRGHLLDSLLDIIGIGVTLWAIGELYPSLSQLALALLLVNFLVYIQNEIQGTKAITYTRGPTTVGLVAQPYFPTLLLMGEPAFAFAGVLIPLILGVGLIFTRLEWRRRLWNYYQFFTAGQRVAYKETPREQRARLRGPGTAGGTPGASPSDLVREDEGTGTPMHPRAR